MILLMDNYDSRMGWLYNALSELAADIRIVRNDEMLAEEVQQLSPQAIVISAGPGNPKDTGLCMDVIRWFAGKVPILGIGLGGYAIAECYGGVFKKTVFGEENTPYNIGLAVQSELFKGMASVICCKEAYGRTLAAETLPECLRMTACDQFGQLSALEHKEYPVYALCFRPEALAEDAGKKILENLIRLGKAGTKTE